MTSRNAQKATKWRRILLGLAGLGVAVGGVCTARSLWLAPADAQPAAAAPQSPPPPPAPTPGTVNQYTSAMVASFNGHTIITRQELGEHLIARLGLEKLDTLINSRLIEKACKERGISVTGAEVEARFAEDLKGINVDRALFVKQFLRRANKNVVEWKEDVLREQLLLTKLCRDRVVVTEEELRDGFEARYGEKVNCRVIHWADKGAAEAEYPGVRDDEKSFADAAKHQHTDALASTGGKIAVFGRHNLENKALEDAAFALQPGEVSPLLASPDGGMVAIKCDARIAPDRAVIFDSVKPAIQTEIREAKVEKERKTMVAALRKEAQPQPLLEKPGANAGNDPTAVVALIYGNVPITRLDLGEFLIKRFGGQQLEMLMNKRIIEQAAKAQRVTVSDDEIEAGYLEDYSKKELKEPEFVEQFLKPNHTTVYQWKEDVVRPRLLLAKLCRGRVRAMESDLQMAYDAHHGERVECRMIIWPDDAGGKRIAMENYGRLRDNDKEFDQAARAQMSPSLAKQGGRVSIGRHTTGNDVLEEKAFGLKPGEVTELFGTPEGLVMLKCDRHVPPDASVSFVDCRAELEREVLDKKIEMEMPRYFAELRSLAAPQALLRNPDAPDRIKEQVEPLVRDVLQGQAPTGH